MTSTFYGSNEPIIRKRAQGYTGPADKPANARYLEHDPAVRRRVAGVHRGRPGQVGRGALTRGAAEAPTLEQMWTAFTLTTASPRTTATAGRSRRCAAAGSIEHGGGIPGFSTFGLRVPEDRVYVAVLCNSDNPKASPGYIAKRVAAIAIGKPFPAHTAVTVDPKVLAGHAGVYEVDKQTRRNVTVEGDKLYTQRTGSSKLEARPSSETEFFYDNSLTHFRFERDASGRTVAMLMYQDGADEPVRAARMADTVAEPMVARVDPAIYDAYAGQYELAPGFILTVTREGDRLMTQATGQEKIEIFPASETEFFPKVVDARITFVRGADGKVDRLVLKQGGAGDDGNAEVGRAARCRQGLSWTPRSASRPARAACLTAPGRLGSPRPRTAGPRAGCSRCRRLRRRSPEVWFGAFGAWKVASIRPLVTT